MQRALPFLITLLVFNTVSAQNEEIARDLAGLDLVFYLQDNFYLESPIRLTAAKEVLFETVDNDNGKITGIYTGFTINATSRAEAYLQDVTYGYIWPKTLFNEFEPMLSDLHNIYPVRIEVDTLRQGLKFDEIPDDETELWFSDDNRLNSIPDTALESYSELLTGISFEPRDEQKGDIARSIFYFWASYQNTFAVNDDAEYFNSMKDVLLEWHISDPVTSAEVSRSMNVESIQGNKNPFVHDTTLIRRAFYNNISTSNVQEEDFASQIKLLQNYPNPFNPETVISYSLAQPGEVSLKIYDSLGREITTLEKGFKTRGNYQIRFNAFGLSTGVYVYQLTAGGEVRSGKMLLIK